MTIKVEVEIPPIYNDKNHQFTYEESMLALKIRLETLNAYKCDDGYEPEYSRKMGEAFGGWQVHAMVHGDTLYEKLIESTLRICNEQVVSRNFAVNGG